MLFTIFLIGYYPTFTFWIDFNFLCSSSDVIIAYSIGKSIYKITKTALCREYFLSSLTVTVGLRNLCLGYATLDERTILLFKKNQEK